MRKKKYWKNVFLAFAESKGRFLSIACLLMIGAMALVGLKATAPNMEQAGQEYVRQSRLADLFVISDYGFSKEDESELRAVKGAKANLPVFPTRRSRTAARRCACFPCRLPAASFSWCKGKSRLKRASLPCQAT